MHFRCRKRFCTSLPNLWKGIRFPLASREPHPGPYRREAFRVQRVWQEIQRERRIEKAHYNSYDEPELLVV